MQVSVNVSDRILDWVLNQVRLDTLPQRVANNLLQWREKAKTPTYNQIEEASRATSIPLGYFFLQDPPAEDLSLVEYRTVDSVALINPSRELIDTMHNMELIQDWMHSRLTAEGASALPFVGSQSAGTSVLVFAKYVRDTLGLDNDWLKKSSGARASFNQARAAMSDAGVVVMTSGIVESNTHRPLNIEEFRAFAMTDALAPLIFINGNDSDNGKLFSLLHEFSHLCLGESSMFNERYHSEQSIGSNETLCNAVAAEILIPEALFIEAWKRENTIAEQTIQTIADDFNCGTTVVARRALNLGYIDYPLYKRTAELAIRLHGEHIKKQKEKQGGDYYRTVSSRLDPRFLEMLVSSVAAGTTPYSDAYRMTCTNRFTFAKLTSDIGGGAK